YLFRPAKGLLGIDDPVLLVQRPYRVAPSRRARQWQGAPCELKLAGLVGGPQGRQVFAAEDPTQHTDGQEPIGPAGYPARYLVARTSRGASRGLRRNRQAAARHHTVNVGMMLQLLPPGVQDHE